MYSISDLLEIGSPEEIIPATKVEDVIEDRSIPSDLPSEQSMNN